MLEKNSAKWKKNGRFEHNCKKCFTPGNPGRGFDESVDLTEALKEHYNPELALMKLKEVHGFLRKGSDLSDDQRKKLGWQEAYNLTTWKEFAGDGDFWGVGQSTSRGPSKEVQVEAQTIRGIFQSRKSK